MHLLNPHEEEQTSSSFRSIGYFVIRPPHLQSRHLFFDIMFSQLCLFETDELHLRYECPYIFDYCHDVDRYIRLDDFVFTYLLFTIENGDDPATVKFDVDLVHATTEYRYPPLSPCYRMVDPSQVQ